MTTQMIELTQRIARSVQTTVGWIFWDPGAIARYTAMGLPEPFASPLGYIAARCAPLAPAGPEAVIAAFGSISPTGIRGTFQALGSAERFRDAWSARDEAVLVGLQQHAPRIIEPLSEAGPDLWAIAQQLPLVGRVMFGAVLSMPRPADPVLSGWHAINALREWRGDTHWAITVAAGLGHAESSILHNAWMTYEKDWLATSRGTSPEEIEKGWSALESRGLAADHEVNAAGLALRQQLEDDTDRLTIEPWVLYGEERTTALAEALEPPCEALLRRVDITAGVNYQPASRRRA